MHLIRASEYRRMRWKNGLGETTEIAVSPQGASLEQFDWRVSMARVEMAGPFSVFAGVDRTIIVLSGAGLRLESDGEPPVDLTPQSPPYSFRGDSPVGAKLTGGTITDFNVMTRRDRLWHRVRRATIGDRASLELAEATVLVFCVTGTAYVERGGLLVEPRAGDTVLVDPGPGALGVAAGGDLLLVEIGRC